MPKLSGIIINYAAGILHACLTVGMCGVWRLQGHEGSIENSEKQNCEDKAADMTYAWNNDKKWVGNK